MTKITRARKQRRKTRATRKARAPVTHNQIALVPSSMTREQVAAMIAREFDAVREEIVGEMIRREGGLTRHYDQQNRSLEHMQIEIDRMLTLLGLNKFTQYSPALSEPVAASYFHSWIARINERLERLEAPARYDEPPDFFTFRGPSNTGEPMRAPGTEPDFPRLNDELARAEDAWQQGDRDKAERILKLLAALAYAASAERGPNAPVPESQAS